MSTIIIKQCPNPECCGDGTAVQVGQYDGEPELIQCEWCHTSVHSKYFIEMQRKLFDEFLKDNKMPIHKHPAGNYAGAPYEDRDKYVTIDWVVINWMFKAWVYSKGKK